MPRYGPGQSGPAPRRAAPKAAPKQAPRRSVTPAQGGAVLARGTFQPSNRKQQAELSQHAASEGNRVADDRRKQGLLTAYKRTSYLREQARQARDQPGDRRPRVADAQEDEARGEPAGHRLERAGRPDIMIAVGGVVPAADHKSLKYAGAAAIFPPGTVIAVAAADLLETLTRQQAPGQAAE